MFRLDHNFYSHLKELWGVVSDPLLTQRKKSPQPDGSRCCITQDSGPKALPTELFWPREAMTTVGN